MTRTCIGQVTRGRIGRKGSYTCGAICAWHNHVTTVLGSVDRESEDGYTGRSLDNNWVCVVFSRKTSVRAAQRTAKDGCAGKSLLHLVLTINR